MMPMSAFAAGDAAVQAEGNVAEVTTANGTSLGQYATLADAIKAAQGSGGSTVKLLADIKTNYHKETKDGNTWFIYTDISGTYTLDLNGYTVNGSLEVKDAKSNLTIKDSKGTGKIDPNDGGNAWPALTVSQGSVTIESGNFAKRVNCKGGATTIKGGTFEKRVICNDSRLTINGGAFKDSVTESVYAGSGGTAAITAGQFKSFRASTSATVSISGGSFDQILCTSGSHLHPAAMLANGYAFADRTNGKKVDGSSEATISNIKVVKADEIHAFVVSVTVGASIDKYQTFEEALTAAQKTKDSVLTLLDDITTAQISITDGDFVLDLNGKKLSGADNAHLIGVWMKSTPAKLTIRDSAGNGTIENTSGNTSVYCNGGDVTIEGGTLKGCLYGEKSGKITIKGGPFSSLQIGSEGVLDHLDTWVDAIAQGKALAKDGKVVRADVKQLNGGPYTVIDHTHSFAKNEADEYKCACGVPCPHTNIDSATGKCNLCGKQAHAAAVIKDGNAATYATAQEAINNANGGTVKLLTDAGEITVSSALKLDCNGHTITKLTVSEGVTLASLLPEYYAFKCDGKWVSDSNLSNKTELANTTNAEAPVKYVKAKNPAITVKYGESYTLSTTFAWTGDPNSSDTRIKWEYKSGGYLHEQAPTLTGHENNSRTMDFPISKDNKRYPAQVGTYTYVVTFTKDGYSKSCEFTVTIEKATPSCTVTMADYTYGETPSNPVLTGTTGNDTVAYYYNTTNSNEGGAAWKNTTALDAGTYYMYAVIGAGTNYNAYTTPTKKFEVKKATPITGEKRTVIGTYGQKLRDIDLNNQTGNIPGRWEWDEPDTKLVKASDSTVDYPVTFTPTDTKNYEIVKTKVSVKVNPAPGRELYKRQLTQRLGDGATKTFKPDWTGLPKDEAGWSYNAKFENPDDVRVTDSSDNIENDVLTYSISGGKAGDTVKCTLTASSTSGNYEAFTITIVITLTEKDRPEVTVKPITVTYDGNPVSADKITGVATFNGNPVEGKWSWKANQSITNVADSGEKTAVFTPTDTANYAAVEKNIRLTINKATPTGTPKYTAITKEGQTLADANLTAEGENKESLFKALGKAIQGIVKWVESEDKTTELDSATKVEQGKAYTWLFTPTDTANYKTLSGTIVLWAKPSSGGFVTPAPVNPDVITVKEDTKDNTTSKPGAETDTTITTKTTVKNTTTETTKNEQGQDVSKTTASVSKDLGDKLLDQAVSNKSDTIEITVKSNETNNNGSGAGASAADSVKATEVELPKATVNAIAKDTNADLVIKTDNGEVVLDNKTLETIAGAAKGDTVTIVVGENTQLKETQKPAEKIVGKNGTLFDLAAKIGERLLHQFEGGKAHVTLPMPEKLKGKDVLVIYIDDNGLCKILNHSVEKIGAEDYIRFTTTHFSTFAVVDKEEAAALIKAQNEAHVKELMQNGKFKVTTTKTSKKSVKVTVTAKNNKTLISDIKTMGYTVKYQFYRSTKKTSGYKLLKTKTTSSFTNTKGKKGTKYYYKARVLVYDGKTLIAKSELKQASCGVRTWTK